MPAHKKAQELHTITDCFSIEPEVYSWFKSKAKKRGDKSKIINLVLIQVKTSPELEARLDEELGKVS